MLISPYWAARKWGFRASRWLRSDLPQRHRWSESSRAITGWLHPNTAGKHTHTHTLLLLTHKSQSHVGMPGTKLPPLFYSRQEITALDAVFLANGYTPESRRGHVGRRHRHVCRRRLTSQCAGHWCLLLETLTSVRPSFCRCKTKTVNVRPLCELRSCSLFVLLDDVTASPSHQTDPAAPR